MQVMKGWELGILESLGKTSEIMVEQDGLQGSSSFESQFQATKIHQPPKLSNRFKSHSEQIAEPSFEPKSSSPRICSYFFQTLFCLYAIMPNNSVQDKDSVPCLLSFVF